MLFLSFTFTGGFLAEFRVKYITKGHPSSIFCGMEKALFSDFPSCWGSKFYTPVLGPLLQSLRHQFLHCIKLTFVSRFLLHLLIFVVTQSDLCCSKATTEFVNVVFANEAAAEMGETLSTFLPPSSCWKLKHCRTILKGKRHTFFFKTLPQVQLSVFAL